MDSPQTESTRKPFSLSLLFQQAKKRTSCIPDSDEPTCQEKAHYPVFNPRDPRHNPEVSVFPWRRQESSSSADSPPHRPMKWAHSLSRRSFCRARSGLLALRAGVRRHSTMEDDFEIGGESRSFVSPVALRRERQRHIDSSGLQTSSTQDDPELGIEMYRMSDPPVSPTSTTLPGPRLPAATESLVRSALESSSTLSLISHEHGPPLVPMPKASGVNSQTVPAQTHINALPNDVPEISSETDGISETSVECLFAFPGIYQETLAQWSKEGKVSQSSDHDLPSNQEFEDHSRIEQTNNTIRPSPPGLLETPQSSTLAQEGAQLLRGDTSSDLEIPDGPPGEGSPSSERSTTYEPILGAAPMTGDFLPLLSPQSHSHIAGYGTFPFAPPASLPHDLGPQGNVLGVRCSGCENPLFTPANSTSPDWTSTEITSRMSISSNPWSNQWSPINSNLYPTSPTADQNEFFLVDGKTNSHHPDRGDQPVKTTHRIDKDDNMNSAVLAQSQDVTSTPRNPVGRDLNGQIDFEDEFTDDEFYPGGCTLPTKYY